MKLELTNRKGQRVVGLLEKPEGEVRGTSVLQHGWGSTKENPTIQAAKRGFHNAGFQTFNFDTTNSFGESEGDYEKSTLQLHWEDFEDVVEWMKLQEWFVEPLALCGHSKGGYAAVRYLQEHNNGAGFLVPIGPTVSGELVLEAERAHNPEMMAEWEHTGTRTTVRNGNVKRKGWWQMEERLKHDLLPRASEVTVPVLIIGGSADGGCLPEHLRMLLETLGSEDKTLHLIEGAPHSYYEPEEQAECSKAITDWLSART